MSVPASSVPAVRASLLASLTAAINDPAVMVCLDDPAQTVANDIVSVAGVRSTITSLQMVGSLQAQAMEETYYLDVIAEVFRGGDDAAGVFGRAASLADTIMAAVRNDPTVGGAVNIVARPDSVEYGKAEWTDNHTGRTCQVTVSIYVRNRL